jgi:NAD(P)H dehydrogenase (quinone)
LIDFFCLDLHFSIEKIQFGGTNYCQVKLGTLLQPLDQPSWYYWIAFGRPSVNQLKKSTLEFCGVKPVRVTYIGPIKNTEISKRKKWLEKIENLGKNLK